MNYRAMAVLIAASWVTGCTVGPNYHRPAVQTPQAFRAPDPLPAQQATSLADLKWWVVFKDEKLQDLIRAALNGESRVDVKSFGGLLADFAAREGASLLIRGLRAVSDFEYEYQMALMNRHLSPKLETVFMVPSLDTTYISASLIREIARYGGDVSTLVHPAVSDALRAKNDGR